MGDQRQCAQSLYKASTYRLWKIDMDFWILPNFHPGNGRYSRLSRRTDPAYLTVILIFTSAVFIDLGGVFSDSLQEADSIPPIS